MFKYARKSLSFLFSLIVVGLIFYYFIYINPDFGFVNDGSKREPALVKRVIDGDTYLLHNGDKVRLLGIDTPEKYNSKKLDKDADRTGQDKKTIRKLGKLSSDYVKDLVEGKKVFLEKEPNYEDKDKYGRLLRYVYLEDGTLVNAKIIQDGYGQVYEKYPVSKTDEFRKYQREARLQKRGLWGNIEGLKQFK
jgi:micrococcal nuclease